MIPAAQVAVVLLAAGRSSRFGEADKLMALLDGVPLALHAARAVAAITPGWRIAVCPHGDAPLARLLAEAGFDVVANPDAGSGLSRSLALGIGAAAKTGAEAALVCLADMPLVDADHLRRLITAFETETRSVIASQAKGIAMPPALFARSAFDELRALHGDRGATALLEGAFHIPARADMLADVDDADDLARLSGGGLGA